MELFLDFITWPLRIISVMAVLWLLWQVFRFENSDDAQDAGYVPWQIQLREAKWPVALCICFIAATIAAAVAFVFVPEPLRSAILNVSGFVFEILKWILIAVTFYGLNWLIWYLHFDKSTDDALDRIPWIFIFVGGLYLFNLRNPAIGVLLFLAVNFFLLWLTYYQLPEGLQQLISDFLFPPKPTLPA